MKTIALSAGHGAGDPGAVYKNLKESELTIKINDRAADMLRTHGLGVLDVPDTLTLQQTIAWINARASQIDLCVEIHINSGGGTGVEGWNYAGQPTESDRLSQFLVDGLAIETGLPNRGIKDETTNRHGRLGFVHDTEPLAVLVECGFIDGDYDFLSNDENLTRLAKGLVRGVVSYLGIPWKPPVPDVPKPAPIDWEAEAKKRQEEADKKYNALYDQKNKLANQVTALEGQIYALEQKIKNTPTIATYTTDDLMREVVKRVSG